MKLHKIKKNDSIIFKFILIGILLLSQSINLMANNIRYDVTQVDSRIYVEFVYTEWTVGSQTVFITVTNKTSDILNVRLNFTVHGSDGQEMSQEIGTWGGTGLVMKPGAKMSGDKNNCMMWYDKPCGSNALNVEVGRSCIQSITFNLLGITNVGEQERKEKEQKEKLELEKEAKREAKVKADNALVEKQKAELIAQQKAESIAQQKKTDEATKQKKQESTRTEVSNNSQTGNQQNTKSNQPYVQKSQTQIDAENRAIQVENERRKKEAAEEQARKLEAEKREMANKEIERIKQRTINEQVAISKMAPMVGKFAEGILSQPGGRLGAIMGIGNAEVFGLSYGDNRKMQINLYSDIDLKNVGLSMDLMLLNGLKLITKNQISDMISICPTIGYTIVTGNVDGTGYHFRESGSAVNYNALTAGLTAFINFGMLYLKVTYSVNAVYFEPNPAYYLPVVKPINESLFSIGVGIGFDK